MAAKDVEVAEMEAEEDAAKEAVVGSIPMAAEAIGMIQEAIKPFDQQGNAGGSPNFFADQQKECGGSAEMAAKDVEVAEMEVEEDAAKEAVVGSIPMAAEAIGMIQEVIKPFDQQGNAGGSRNFLQISRKNAEVLPRWRQRT